jgi:hypothetical protein
VAVVMAARCFSKQAEDDGNEREEAAQFLLDQQDNLDCDEGYSASNPVDLARVEQCLAHLKDNSLPADAVLLDSCSSVNLLSNPDLLDDIHECSQTMHVSCNAGVGPPTSVHASASSPRRFGTTPRPRPTSSPFTSCRSITMCATTTSGRTPSLSPPQQGNASSLSPSAKGCTHALKSRPELGLHHHSR